MTCLPQQNDLCSQSRVSPVALPGGNMPLHHQREEQQRLAIESATTTMMTTAAVDKTMMEGLIKIPQKNKGKRVSFSLNSNDGGDKVHQGAEMISDGGDWYSKSEYAAFKKERRAAKIMFQEFGSVDVENTDVTSCWGLETNLCKRRRALKDERQEAAWCTVLQEQDYCHATPESIGLAYQKITAQSQNDAEELASKYCQELQEGTKLKSKFRRTLSGKMIRYTIRKKIFG